MMERYKSLETQMIEPIILDKLGEVSDDGWDNEWDDEYYESSFDDLTERYHDFIIEDPTGSWLDSWSKM
jgi:hypothetical protein